MKMQKNELVCTSCSDNLISEDEFSIFKCPACGEREIVRCRKCRRKSTIYRCSCGFEGP